MGKSKINEKLPESGTAGDEETTFVELTNSVVFHGITVPHCVEEIFLKLVLQ